MTDTLPKVDPAEAPEVIGWVNLDTLLATQTWAANEDIEDVRDALAAAHQQCLDFLNGRVPDPVPVRLKLAQQKQARALIRADNAGDGGQQLGPDDFAVTVFPMDWTVKALLRPKKGRRSVR